jgi:hypothetical protein
MSTARMLSMPTLASSAQAQMVTRNVDKPLQILDL